MTNWFERNTTVSIIIYTITIASASIVVTKFLIDERKIEILNSKISYLADQNENLRKDNEIYLKLLSELPGSAIFFKEKIRKLEQEKNKKEKVTIYNNLSNNTVNENDQKYSFAKKLSSGEAFVDPKTQITAGISSINDKFNADIIITDPNNKVIIKRNISAGFVFEFSKNEKKYKLIILELNYFSNSFKIEVISI
ncbi:hypothetical protein EHQ94_10855 [Leptospira meyeri]|uniref:hypothetical protein n=1 Tax=Leptospira meyeri TaxID=29508 RepID=UPI0010829824|nr:hypothetical protein [Leptospira meyeri]MCW7490925.1 hypothetical protein [Leptospira meyeri]TGM58955.1 hypothetical protein EHQ93_19675 [Leptospira meyeri]TGM66503.1 hypothetical protein EHQ94_10855 [Leptospira meyeri]